MNILVYDVAASKGGALSILKEFYDKYKRDFKNRYFFVISKPKLENTNSIKILKYPWIKKSWLHRMYFDLFIIQGIIKEYEIDKIISLQNIMVFRTNIPQTLYLHQALPFTKYKFKIFEHNLFWIYQNIIGRLIKYSLKNSAGIIVQTEWIKNACIKECNIPEEKIKVVYPIIDKVHIKKFSLKQYNCSDFFYPAGAQMYKNHIVVLKACILLKKYNLKPYKIIFTLTGKENSYAKKLYDYCVKNDLPVKFVGDLSKEKVFCMYSKSILLFPSYIETFGLPLLEGKMSGCPIIASNMEFSQEILSKYKNAVFCNPFDEKMWCSAIYDKLCKDMIN